MNFSNYIFKGLIHYLYILFNLVDFKDYGFLIFILMGLFILFIFSKTIRESILNLIKTFLNIVKTIPGFLFLVLFSSYYIYILILFEEKISILILVMSIYLTIKSFVETNLALLADSKKTIKTVIWDFIKVILLLIIQQLVFTLEFENFNNIKYIFIPLILIPIYSILFFALKNYVNYDNFYKKYIRKTNLSHYELYKLFNYSLSVCETYKNNEILLSKLLTENKFLTYNEYIVKIDEIFPSIINYFNNTKETKIHKKIIRSKIYLLFHYIWIFNILVVIYYIVKIRFFELNPSFEYYIILAILYIYLWYDMMKIKEIKNQYDFCIYSFIYILTIIFILKYSISLVQFRLSEIGFVIPLFIFFRYISYNKNPINFLSLPFLSEENFFGLDPKNYKK